MMLVTGGAGFIGSHLVRKLLSLGNEVRVLDDLSSGRIENVKGAEFIRGDVRSESDCRKAAKGCECIFHLAALTDLRESGDKIFQVNFIGSKNVFAAAEKEGAKVIFTSSAAVYGNGPTLESSPVAPITDYGKSKAKAEKILKSGFVARLFNVYGPGGKSVINKFSKGICSEEQITLYGNGLQTRDYVHVNDVVNALLLGMEKEGIYNVGTGIETGLLNAITMIEQSCGRKVSIKFNAPKEGEIQRSKASINKMKGIGWKPSIKLGAGIAALAKTYHN